MIAWEIGAVVSFKGFDLEMRSEPFIQMFQNETFTNTIGGAIDIDNLNSGGVTIVFDSVFYNNFGRKTNPYAFGSIMLDRGGIILA